jgi:hypothetical protein
MLPVPLRARWRRLVATLTLLLADEDGKQGFASDREQIGSSLWKSTTSALPTNP